MPEKLNGETAVQAASPAVDVTDDSAASEGQARFMARLQAFMGDQELTEENMRKAFSNMTAEQRQELLSEGDDFKQEILTKKEHKEDRKIFFQTYNRSADEANMPIDKDTEFLAKKIAAFMTSSSADVPQLLLIEALASTPYMVKAALMEAKDASAAKVPQEDLAEVETALSLLKVDGWRDGESAARPPVVRRNLLLLQSHLHRERLRALKLCEATQCAANEVVAKCRRLLDVLFAYSLRCSWIKALLTITELQSLLVFGLWDHEDDECRAHMRQRLHTFGLKQPKLTLRGECSDVPPGERVTLRVSLTRSHAHSATELEVYRQAAAAEAAEAASGEAGKTDGAAPTGSLEEDGKEGWWLLVESIRGLNGMHQAGLQSSEPVHNALVGWVALAPTLDQATVEAEVEFTAPASAGEYKVIAHIRSSSMVGVDVKRKVSFTVNRSKRALPSSSGSGSTEPAETVAAMDAAIAEMSVQEEAEAAAAYGAQESSQEPAELQNE